MTDFTTLIYLAEAGIAVGIITCAIHLVTLGLVWKTFQGFKEFSTADMRLLIKKGKEWIATDADRDARNKQLEGN